MSESNHSQSGDDLDDAADHETHALMQERDDLIVARDVLLVQVSVAHTHLARKEIELQELSASTTAEIAALSARLQVRFGLHSFGLF